MSTLKSSDVWRPTSERERILTRSVDPTHQKGLEIGALHNPIVPPGRADVLYVDYADTQTLKKRHSTHPEWVAGMVEVDYVWRGSGSLADVIGDKEIFDFVIASHVIEHVPNMLGWFRGISEVMKCGAVFNLACPDMRFTFDVRCPKSTLGEIIEADLLQYELPSVRQMFDHCYYGKAIEPGEIWTRKLDIDATSAYSGDIAPDLAFAQAAAIVDSRAYFDSHCWIFTPLSFLDLMEGAARVADFPLMLEALMPTELGSFEFFVTFVKPAQLAQCTMRETQLEKIRQIREECLNQKRWSTLLASE